MAELTDWLDGQIAVDRVDQAAANWHSGDWRYDGCGGKYQRTARPHRSFLPGEDHRIEAAVATLKGLGIRRLRVPLRRNLPVQATMTAPDG